MMNYTEKRILRLSGSVDREIYLKLLDSMHVSKEDVEFGLEKELEFLKNIRKRKKIRRESY